MAEVIDEDVRRRFEADRISGGQTPVDEFLAGVDDTHRAATLEELVCIELEFCARRGDGV